MFKYLCITWCHTCPNITLLPLLSVNSIGESSASAIYDVDAYIRITAVLIFRTAALSLVYWLYIIDHNYEFQNKSKHGCNVMAVISTIKNIVFFFLTQLLFFGQTCWQWEIQTRRPSWLCPLLLVLYFLYFLWPASWSVAGKRPWAFSWFCVIYHILCILTR